MDSAGWVEAFRRHLVQERRVSLHTVRAYLGDLARFQAYAAGQGVELVAVTHQTLRGHLGVLAVDHHPSSRGRALASLRAFYAFLLRQGAIAASPASSRSRAKVQFGRHNPRDTIHKVLGGLEHVVFGSS